MRRSLYLAAKSFSNFIPLKHHLSHPHPLCAQPGGLPPTPCRLLTARLLLDSSSEKRHLQVNVTNPVQCSLHGKKCTVSVETRLNQPQPDFTKNRSGFILSVPGN